MNIRSKSFFSRPQVAALALAGALLWMGAPSAQAQLFNWDPALPATQVEHMIQASGYRLTGPLIRRGPVYLADVLGRENDPERLVIDAREGRLLQRYQRRPTALARQAVISGDWSSQPPQTGAFFSWFGREDDIAPPRPPASIGGDAGAEPLRAAPVAPAHASSVKEVARADDSSSPHVIMAPTAVTRAPALEKPRLKPQVKHKKPEPTPVAQPAVATPARADAAGAAPRVADTKAAAPSAPQTAPLAPGAPTPKVSAPKPALNDVPVAPLE